MELKKFKLWNNLTAALVFVISAVTYLCTMEPTASFWDCGEFIASSYKLEVGHPPGNPVFQLFARIFTMFGDKEHAAILVNSMSALASALTIFLLYYTIVFFAKRLVRKEENGLYSTGSAIAIFGAGAVGALAYAFSDTFWFSAVEAEVYAMSSLFTALVFWLMTKWYEQADEPHAGRWIVLICFVMGLSIGIHLLNLLTAPALLFMYYYRKRENAKYNFKELVKIILLSVVILGIMVFLFIPYLPKVAAYFDLFFVNVLHLPYNTGAAFFLLGLLALLFWGLFFTMKKQKAFANTLILCSTTIVIGFSIFSIDVIRSCAKTPTNEYQPDNAFTLVRYLSREQYGSTPLIYGQYFDAPYQLKGGTYWAPVDGKYKKVPSPVDAQYSSSGKMLFPRMWANDERYIPFYQSYTHGKGTRVKGAEHPKPTFFANMAYFFDYQLNWMYWRYFMWNFVGRQNEIHSPTPGDIFYGNWESGIKPLDQIRLGDQSEAPGLLADNKGKNHYFFLPLLLGLLGLFFQFDKDKRGSWLVFLLFFMTGIAIVLYLNQPPYQVRERDYAYAGSFYAFSIWVGLGVVALYQWINKASKGSKQVAVAAGVTTVSLLCVPALMAQQNWDDHDRSNRYTAVEMARDYLNSVGQNGVLVTHGDNDTFPLWYAQEVEEIRPDVRICNTSLLGTDWHIDQMKYAVNQSAPLNLSIGQDQYLYGTNEIVYFNDKDDAATMLLKDAVALFKDPKHKLPLSSGRKVDYFPCHKLIIPVDTVNVFKYGIVSEKLRSKVPSEIVLTISAGKQYLTKPELFTLDLLANYKWDRPLHFLNMGGDLNVGIKEYLSFEGYSYKFTPIKNKISSLDAGIVDTDHLYKNMTEVYTWDRLAQDNYFIDYQNQYTFLGVLNLRAIFTTCAKAFMAQGENDRALEMLDKCQEVMHRFPLCGIPLGFPGSDSMVIQQITYYYSLGKEEQADELASKYWDELYESFCFFTNPDFYAYTSNEFEYCRSAAVSVIDVVRKGGNKDLQKRMMDEYNALARSLGAE